MIKPKGMPSGRWEQFKTRAEKYATNRKPENVGQHRKYYNEALKFYTARWLGKDPHVPKGMPLSKKAPKQAVGRIISW